MKNSFKILTILGTRPEIIKLSEFIKKADKYFFHKIVHTGQNHDYELNEIFFSDLNLRKPDYFLNCATGKPNMDISNIFKKLDKILELEKPKGVVILGDTNSGISSICAKKRNIQVFHLEAGNRSFDDKVPEELNRKIIDHVSDINFTYTDLAKNYLINEGLPANRIIKVGSPMGEVLFKNKNKISKSSILKKLKLKKKNYFLVSLHREDNVDQIENLKKFIELLLWLSKKYKKKIIISTHYRTQKKLEKLKIKKNNNIFFLKPFSFSDYVKLQLNCFILLSDSGTLTEEASILNIKSLNLRNSHERPEGCEEAVSIMTGLNISKVQMGIEIITNESKAKIVMDYFDKNFSSKVIKNILSYFNYEVNKTI